MAIQREFVQDGHTYLYRVSPLPEKGRLWAELRVLRECTKLGETVYAQPQLLSYRGPGEEQKVDAQMRALAEDRYGVRIPR